MKDIDFDELDQAVNSLMSSASAANRTENTSTGPSDRSQAPSNRVNNADKRPTRVLPRSSRFMDVVDSNSELNPFKKAAAPTVLRPKRSVDDKPKSVSAADIHIGLRKNTATRQTFATKPTDQTQVKPAEDTTPVAKVEESKVDDSKAESVVVRRIGKTITPAPLDVSKDTSLELGDDQKVLPDDSDTRPMGVFGQPESEPNVQTAPEVKESVAVSDFTLNDLSKELQSQLDTVFGGESIETKVASAAPVQELPAEPAAPQTSSRDVSSGNDNRATLIPVSGVAAPASPATVVASDDSAALPADEIQPAGESPFVDVKIEKRPLNANAPEVAEQAEESIAFKLGELSEKLAHSSEPVSGTKIDVENETEAEDEATLAPELSNELIAIEATGSVSAEESDAAHTKAAPLSVGPSSIAPQYQQGESSGDTTHAPIYDTTQYADPVAHPAKKKTGWLWVVGVLVLLALGSGGAVALYLTGIIP